ncbi:MAG: hypothetical protein WKF83_05760 [Nocardioidaceae bacterium]
MAAQRRPRGYRYGSWRGGRDPLAPPFDARAAVDAIGADVMGGSNVRSAVERLLRRGMSGREGLDALRERLRTSACGAAAARQPFGHARPGTRRA